MCNHPHFVADSHPGALAAIRFVLNDVSSSISQQERQKLMHVSADERLLEPPKLATALSLLPALPARKSSLSATSGHSPRGCPARAGGRGPRSHVRLR